jgi:hypothetical protein
MQFIYRVIMDVNIIDLKFKMPFTCMLAGPTGSGKTVLTRDILKDFEHLMHPNVDILKVLWCYGIYQPLYNVSISDKVICKYNAGLGSEQEILADKPHIIVIDDLMNQLGSDPALADLFTKGSHHHNISVIFITQNMFHKGNQMRNISLNCHYYIFLKNPRDKTQIQYFARQIYPNKSKFLINAYEDATSVPHGYLKLDLTQSTPDNYRVRTRITSKEVADLGVNFSPIIYIP